MELFDIPENSQIRFRLGGALKDAYRAKDLVQQALVLKNQSEQRWDAVNSFINDKSKQVNRQCAEIVMKALNE